MPSFNFLTCGIEQVIARMRSVSKLVLDILITIHSSLRTNSIKLQANTAQVERLRLQPIFQVRLAGWTIISQRLFNKSMDSISKKQIHSNKKNEHDSMSLELCAHKRQICC